MNDVSSSRRPAQTRRLIVLALLVLAVAAIALANAQWLSVSTTSVLGEPLHVSASGQDISPGLTAAGVVAIASSLFLSISGRVGKYVALSLSALSGLLIVFASYLVLDDQQGSLVSRYADVTGSDAVPSGVVASASGYLTITCAGALALTAIIGMVFARKWQQAGSKYTVNPNRSVVETQRVAGRPSGEVQSDERQMWDALSEGIDPTAK